MTWQKTKPTVRDRANLLLAIIRQADSPDIGARRAGDLYKDAKDAAESLLRDLDGLEWLGCNEKTQGEIVLFQGLSQARGDARTSALCLRWLGQEWREAGLTDLGNREVAALSIEEVDSLVREALGNYQNGSKS